MPQNRRGEPISIAVFFTAACYGLPHLSSFIEYNPEIPFFIVSGETLMGAEKEQAWRNADRAIRKWWVQEGSRIEFDYAVLLEWDVLFMEKIDAIFPADAHFYCKDVLKPGCNWWWLPEVANLPTELQPFMTGAAPLAVLRLSRECLAAIFSHPLADEAFEKDIFCEVRLATLAEACGFGPIPCPGTLPDIDWCPVPVTRNGGVWHAVKTAIFH